MSTSKWPSRFLFAFSNTIFDLTLTEYMLRRYAAGSSFGSGGSGKVTSGIEGELNCRPLVVLVGGGERKVAEELRLLSLVTESLSAVGLEFLRLKRPISRVVGSPNVESPLCYPRTGLADIFYGQRSSQKMVEGYSCTR